MKLAALLCGVLAVVSCMPTAPSELPSAHEEVIQSEWAIAQRLLSDVGVTRSDLVTPDQCTWIPHDGPLPYNGGYANGLFTPYTVRWNVRTPTVLRHEAGHAILYKLGHACKSCWSVDATISLHPGRCETSAIGRHCAALLGGP